MPTHFLPSFFSFFLPSSLLFFPFNLNKGGINASLTLVLYKPMVSALRRIKAIPSESKGEKKPIRLGLSAIGLAFLLVFVLAFLIFTGVI